MSSAIYLHAITPVHSGTGQSAASDIDLPIAREKVTNWPVLPATSLKGVLRDVLQNVTSEADRDKLFGTPDNVGALQFGDAHLLCFPVRSWQGVFAYVTCPLVLNRLYRDFTALGIRVPFKTEVPSVEAEQGLIASGSQLVAQGESEVWLEDLKLRVVSDPDVRSIADSIGEIVFPNPGERPAFTERFIIVGDDIFDFLAETATEVTARIKLKDDGTKTVQSGGLWYEEAVPAEAIFVAPLLGGVLPPLARSVVQIGGNETVGRGFCRVMVDTQ